MRTTAHWNEQEDKKLIQLVNEHGKQWDMIAAKFGDRTPAQVAARYDKSLDPNLKKGPFTPEEDRLIRDFVNFNGAQNWPRIVDYVPSRSAKQCRERWYNHLNPMVSKHGWTPQEDQLIFENYQKMGGKWAVIAKMIPGRTDNSIKNRWNSSISKRIIADQNGVKSILPDPSKRKTGNSKKERPPPLYIAPSFNGQGKNEGQGLISPTTFPISAGFVPESDNFLSPESPLPTYQNAVNGFGLLNSPGYQISSIFSPTKPGFDGTLFNKF